MKSLFRFIAVLLSLFWASSNIALSLREKLSFEQLTVRSHIVVRANVTEIRSEFSDPDQKEIMTFISLQIREFAKGYLSEPSVSVVIPGGNIGNFATYVAGTPSFFIGEEVIVFISNDYMGRATITGMRQGKLKIENQQVEIDGNFVSVDELIGAIRKFVTSGERGIISYGFKSPRKNYEGIQGALIAPSISSVNPTVGSAIRPYAINLNDPFNPGDRGTFIDIYGSGFGSTQGTSFVRFNGATAQDYLLWSDTHITCKVPGRQWDGQSFQNASSGILYVSTSGGQSNNVQFSATFASPSKRSLNLPIPYYINQNGTPDCGSEFTAIQNSFQTWEDVSQSNLDYDYKGTTTINQSADDGFNVCMWRESNWQYGDAIGATIIRFNSDMNSLELLSFDMLLNGQTYNWSCSGEAGKQDVQNVVTHEAGHTLNLLDLYGGNDAEKTMYGFGALGETKKRTLEADDIAGVRYIYPQPYSLTLQNSFEFDGTPGGQVSVKNVSQGTNTISYNAPLIRTVNYGTTFEFIALSQQTINSRDYRFAGWADNVMLTNRQVTISGPGTYTAKYAWHLHSGSAVATTYNNQRKMVYDGANYHLVYESSGEIYYTYSNDNGNTWSNELIISDNNGGNKYPSIDIVNQIVVVVWQQEFPSTGRICMRRKTAGGWQAQQIVSEFFASPGFIATPVVSVGGGDYYHVVWHDYDNTNLTIRSYNPSNGSWSNETTIPSTNSNSLHPSLTADTYNFHHLAWAESGTIYYTKISYSGSSYTFSPNKENVSNGTGYSNHVYPSITTDYSRRPSIAWQAYSGPALELQIILQRRRELSGAWSSSTSFIGNDDHYKPSITSYPNVTNNQKLRIAWRLASATLKLAKYDGTSWSQFTESATGNDPNISFSMNGSEAAKIVLRSGSASPYTITTTSQNLPKATATRIAHYRRGVMRIGKVEMSFDLGDFYLQSDGGLIPIDLFSYNDTLVVGLTGEWNDMFRTEPVILPANSVLVSQNGFSVINPQLLGNVLPLGTSVSFALEAVHAITNTPLATLYKQVVSRVDTSLFWGKRQFRVPSTLVGQPVYLRVVVSTLGSIVAKPSLVEIYQEVPDSSSLDKPEPANGVAVPKTLALYPNYPNPFNPETVIRFDLPEASEIELAIFNAIGAKVKTLVNGRCAAGQYMEIWDGRNARGELVASGIYFLKMRAGDFTATQSMILLR